MNTFQRMLLALLPRGLADSVQTHSQNWQIRCCTCGRARSVWDAGGIRWHAASKGKRRLVYCSACGRLRMAAVERRRIVG